MYNRFWEVVDSTQDSYLQSTCDALNSIPLKLLEYLWTVNCHTHTCTHTHNSYIPQTEQHEPEGQMLFCLGNVTSQMVGP